MANKSKPEIRLDQSTVIVGLVIIAVVAVLAMGGPGNMTGMFAGGDVDKDTGDQNQTDDQPDNGGAKVPALEKTNVYLSAYDMADYEGEDQQNRVGGTADVIKSGNVIEQVNLSTASGARTTAEFNGGDEVTILADNGDSYYAHANENVEITETLQPIATYVKAAAQPDVYLMDDGKDEMNTPYTVTLAANEVSKTHYVRIERPGDDNFYQACGIGVDFNDDVLDVRAKELAGNDKGSYTTGVDSLMDDYDNLDSQGVDRVWSFDKTLKNFDELDVPVVIGTQKDEDPSGETVEVTVFDCEQNLQNGQIVTSSEDASDAHVGLANTKFNITVN